MYNYGQSATTNSYINLPFPATFSLIREDTGERESFTTDSVALQIYYYLDPTDNYLQKPVRVIIQPHQPHGTDFSPVACYLFPSVDASLSLLGDVQPPVDDADNLTVLFDILEHAVSSTEEDADSAAAEHATLVHSAPAVPVRPVVDSTDSSEDGWMHQFYTQYLPAYLHACFKRGIVASGAVENAAERAMVLEAATKNVCFDKHESRDLLDEIAAADIEIAKAG